VTKGIVRRSKLGSSSKCVGAVFLRPQIEQGFYGVVPEKKEEQKECLRKWFGNEQPRLPV